MPDTLVLMLTAKGRDTDVAKGLALGADAYMTKPFSTRELVQKVRELLGRRRRPHEAPAACCWPTGLAAWRGGRCCWLVLGTTVPGVGHAGAGGAPARGAAGGRAGAGGMMAGAVLLLVAGAVGAAAATGAGCGAARLREQARVLVSAPSRSSASPGGENAGADLATAPSTSWPAQRDQLRATWPPRCQASRVQQERNRLAALMSELTQSVVVCNLDGRILLYNNRARMQFRPCQRCANAGRRGRADRPGPQHLHRVRPQAGGARAGEHQQRMQRGAGQPVAQFVTTTRSGQLLRARWRRCAAWRRRRGGRRR
jgi:PAS domain-containing protein